MPTSSNTQVLLLGIVSTFLEQQPIKIRSELSLSELGADSFDMVELQALIEEALDIRIDPQLGAHLTFDELSQKVLRLSAQTARC